MDPVVKLYFLIFESMIGYLVGYILLVACSSHFTFSIVFSLVLYGQQNAKKLKLMKQQPDNAFDINPSGSIPSPVGSQMSNMSNPNKIIRLIHGRDRGRKAKTPKVCFHLLIFCLVDHVLHGCLFSCLIIIIM